jgi:selenide,water dikinase
MCTLNTVGEVFGSLEYVHAMTDVTGFGLLGHLLEMCDGSGLYAEINYSEVKLIEGVEALAKKFIAPDNTFRNWKSFQPKTEGISGERFVTLCDPQTSGGLLVAVNEEFSNDFIQTLKDHDLKEFIEPIGRMTKKSNGKVISVK